MSRFDVPSIMRDVPSPRPKPLPSDPWHVVRHPLLRGVRTFFRDADIAAEYAEALDRRYGQGSVGNRPRVEIVDGLPDVNH